jgi:hypothetical protein
MTEATAVAITNECVRRNEMSADAAAVMMEGR